MERRYDLHHYEIIMLPTRQYFDRQVIMHMNWILGIVGKCWSFSECPKCTTFLFRKYWRDWLQELNGSGMKWLGSNRHYNDFTHYAGTRNRKLSFVKKPFIYSIDICNLYPSIEPSHAVPILTEFISKYLDTTHLTAYGLSSLLNLFFENNIFSFKTYF